MRLTRGEQEPYSLGTFSIKSYSIADLASAAPAQPTLQIAQAVPPPAAAAQAAPAPLPATGIANANPAAPANNQHVFQNFILDNHKLMSVGGMFSINKATFTGSGIGTFVFNFAFYEKYGTYGNFFFIPNSFFASAEYMLQGDSAFKARSTSIMDDDGGLDPGFTGLYFSLGALYKIRIGAEQKFIFNIGPSIGFFAGRATLSYNSDKIDNAQIVNKREYYSLGLCFNTGFCFRFTPMIAMDLGINWRLGTTNLYYNDLVEFETESGLKSFISNSGVRPDIISIGLGVTFWIPR